MTETAKATTEQRRQIGKYRVIGKLGKGGMAEVLLTLQHDEGSDFKRLVVVKKILDELVSEDPQFVKMFLDEARLAARLSHPNVVQTYEVGEYDGAPFLAMEFLDGQALNIVQRRSKQKSQPIPVDAALRIVCDVLEALHYAHELKDFDGTALNVIHRDVTPSNIFVKYDGLTKLVDFGIAKSATQREKTRAGTLKGKVPYMAPEQLRDEPVSRSIDVWAVGCVLWETLATERLFLGKNDFETVQNVMTKKVPLLAERRTDVPASLDAVIADALNRDPKKRIQTAIEFKERLEDEAVKMGKALRASSVKAGMEKLFEDVIEQNKKLVKDYLEAGSGGTTTEVIRMRSTGTLEMVRPGADDKAGSSVEMSSTPSNSLSRDVGTGEVPTTLYAPEVVEVDEGSVKSAPVDKPKPAAAVKSLNPPARSDSLAKGPTANENSDLAEGDDYEPRPAWHWAVLAIAIAIAASAVYVLLIK